MKIKLSTSPPTGQSAFTMVEIAIALGVIAFAMVAIIGILPTGLNVQKENREGTLISHDGPYFLEAIRGGSQGLNSLTQHVESITITSFSNDITTVTIYTNSPGIASPVNGVFYNGNMTNGQWIIGLLATPKYTSPNGYTTNGFTNKIDARVHAMSGAAVEQPGGAQDLSFSYSVLSEVVPMTIHSANTSTNAGDTLAYTKLGANLYELRLNFRWPLLPAAAPRNIGSGRRIFRTLVSGQLAPEPGVPLYFFKPQSFAQLQ